jgi:site-specific DNA recombinase
VQWQAPFGYRRLPRSAAGPAHLEVHEPEAAVVRAIFDHYTAGGLSMRQITRRLADDQIPSPYGRAVWNISTISGLLTNRAYIGSWYYNRSESLPAKGPTGSERRRARPPEEWIPIPVPPIVTEDTFEAAQAVSRDNSAWSPRNTTPGAWLLRGLVVCGACGVRISCRQMKPKTKIHRYYWCQNHDPLRAGGEDRRCPERHIRADELDRFVFNEVRQALLRPEVLLAGENAPAAATPTPDDELLAAQLGRLERRVERAETERRRLIDVYQTGLIDKTELTRRAADIDARHRQLQAERTSLIEQRGELSRGNQLRRRVNNFATKVTHTIDELDFEQRQRLLRLVVEEVRVKGWQVEIRLRIPLDESPGHRPLPGGSVPNADDDDPPPQPSTRLSTDMRLRSARRDHLEVVVRVAQLPNAQHEPSSLPFTVRESRLMT